MLQFAAMRYGNDNKIRGWNIGMLLLADAHRGDELDALRSSVRCQSCNTRQCCSLLIVVAKHRRATAIIYYGW